MLGAASWQRTTGPTYPLRGTAELEGARYEYELVRSGTSTEDAVVELPDPGEYAATLVYRRYPVDEPYRRVPFAATERGTVSATLPRQPAAGKMEYFIELEGPGPSVRLPGSAAEDPIIRFKDPVPLAALLPHVILMFLAILVGLRAGLGAVIGRRDTVRYAWLALGLMSVGGMIMGPIVQKHAFGAYWTGFPFGYDLTDNKTLIMWLVWLAACGVLWWERRRGDRVDGGGRGRDGGDGARSRRRVGPAGRAAVLAATAVMLVVYLVPHSMRGSELDYDALEQGVDPAEAVRTGG
jgi:hypothetical protein